MITIVDYGLGNVRAFLNVYKRLNIEVRTASSASQLLRASKVILPGVGAFDYAMDRLEQSGMRGALDELALQRRVPILGVCVGMQMLARGSDEGSRSGLGWIDARVRGFESLGIEALQLPHMGWNDVRPNPGNGLFMRLETDARFYFLHSFYFECAQQADVAASARYGVEFTCAVASANIFGVQFHPEKSHQVGTQLLKNFAEI